MLHPTYKYAYFKKAGWEPEWIEVAEEIVRNRFDTSYTEVPEPEDNVEEGEDDGEDDFEDDSNEQDNSGMDVDDAPGPSRSQVCNSSYVYTEN